MFVGHRGAKIEYISATPILDRNVNSFRLEGPLTRQSPTFLMANYEVQNGHLVAKKPGQQEQAEAPAQQLSSGMRVAMISSYGTNCGMSTYCKYVLDELKPLVRDVKVFAEFDKDADDNPTVIRCWDRSSGNYDRVVSEVVKYAPDVVYVQHEYGSFHNPVQWNTMLGHLNSLFRTIVVLHSVYDHADKLIFEAPCNEIIVHSLYGRDLLRKKGVTHPTIHYVPHGCCPPKAMNTRFSAAASQHVIFQYGFGFEYKGWSTANDIMEIVKREWENATYIGIFNTSKGCLSMHNTYYDRLMSTIRDKKLENNIVLHKGYRSEEILLSYMKQSKVNIFPYWNHPDWLVHGASGAVRLALASGTPTILGDVPFFYEFRGYVPVCATLDDYVREITEIFKNPAYGDSIRKRMLDFIGERTWDKVAQWYLECKPDAAFTAPIPGATK